MSSIGKGFALILILIMAISCVSLFMTKPALAQSIPKPSVPTFTTKFVNASYNVTTTNSYTGKSETQQISNDSVEITIKNQQLDYSINGLSYQIYFDVRAKPHFADNWTELYPLENLTSSHNNVAFSYAQYIDDSLPQSISSYTISTLPVLSTDIYGASASSYEIQTFYSGNENRNSGYASFLTAIPYGGQVDFQVEAFIGHNSTYWYIQHPLFPTYGGLYEPAIAYDSSSGWSSTQTITIGENSTSSSPTPNSTSTPTVPEASYFAFGRLLLVPNQL